MFICEDCGCVFEEGPCPNCNSENYEEAYFCKKCSTWHLPDEMQSYTCCKACVFENMNEETILRYIDDCKMAAEFYVEFYTGSEFSWISHNRISDMLISICKEDFQKKDGDTRLKYLKDFVLDDPGYFAGWLEEDSESPSV